jgi:hypothetical protein
MINESANGRKIMEKSRERHKIRRAKKAYPQQKRMNSSPKKSRLILRECNRMPQETAAMPAKQTIAVLAPLNLPNREIKGVRHT